MALTDKLSAIGTAIRNKTGKTALMTLDEMPTEIASITSGGDPVINPLEVTANGTYTATDCDGYSPITVNVPQEGVPTDAELTITDSVDYMFYNGKWDWFVENYGSKLKTSNLFSCSNAFTNSHVQSIPFTFNMRTTDLNHQCGNMFFGCQNLTMCPTFNNLSAGYITGMFGVCNQLKNITTVIDWTYANSLTSSGSVDASSLFTNCSRLRTIDSSWFDADYLCDTWGSIYYCGFMGCNSLDELVNLPVFTKVTWTDNAFYNFVSDGTVGGMCSRLKNLTFKTNNGSPYVVNWSNQVIDLGFSGFFRFEDFALAFGFSTSTQITDSESYERLKNNEDSWTVDANYSRYNHDSAVRTINSLPDTSSFIAANGGTNTIKFYDMGNSTDGGAISTLTAEEIAVATAKGWTVTLV